MANTHQNGSDVYEIDLRECLEVILKKKGLIAGIVLTAAIISAIISFTLPKIYEVSMIIEPPVNAITDTGVQNWDSVSNIKAKILAGAFERKILGDLKLTEASLHFNVVQPKDTRLLRISISRRADDLETAKMILNKLLGELSASYIKILEDKRDKIENQIKMINLQISGQEEDIKRRQAELKELSVREQQFLEEMKETRENTDKLNKKREAVFERKEGKDDLATLFYAATIQQDTAYYTRLQNDLFSLRTRKGDIQTAIENTRLGINQRRVDQANLNLSKDAVQNILVIQEPMVSLAPIGPNKRKNVLAAALLGLVLGLLATSIQEFWERSA